MSLRKDLAILLYGVSNMYCQDACNIVNINQNIRVLLLGHFCVSFYMSIEGPMSRYIVYFSPRLRSQRLESFQSQLAEKEAFLNDIMRRKGFRSQRDMIGTIGSGLKGFRNLGDIRYSELTFTYSLKHSAIQRRTNTFGYTILFTNTQFLASEILKIYREKDEGEKAFSHFKPHLEPFLYRTEEETRARLFLTILGYTMIAIMAAKCNVTYNRVLETISGIREVVYANGSHAHVEYTKEERELMEKLKIEL